MPNLGKENTVLNSIFFLCKLKHNGIMCQDITNSIKQGTLKIFMCYLTVVIYTLAELISTSDIVKNIAIWLMLSGDPGIICDKCFNISPWWTVIHDYTGRSKCWWRKEKLLLLILSVHNTWKTTDYSIKGQNVHPVVTNAVYMEKLLIFPPWNFYSFLYLVEVQFANFHNLRCPSARKRQLH